AAGDVRWLGEARALEALLAKHFFDDASGGYFFVADDHEALIHRSKDPYDGATPSGNSVATLALLRLHQLTGDVAMRTRAERTLKLYASALATSPRAFPQMLLAADFQLGPAQTLVLIDDGSDQARQMRREVTQSFFPRLTLAGTRLDASPGDADVAAILAGKQPLQGKATAYLCEGFACKAPVTTAAELHAQLAR
ncbi:MAG: thioredoxin domain-containing protein, partial [Planctomycetota bacterium]